MKTERTMDVRALVTPNCAIDDRNQITSHKTLQNPETKMNQKNHAIDWRLLVHSWDERIGAINCLRFTEATIHGI